MLKEFLNAINLVGTFSAVTFQLNFLKIFENPESLAIIFKLVKMQ